MDTTVLLSFLNLKVFTKISRKPTVEIIDNIDPSKEFDYLQPKG